MLGRRARRGFLESIRAAADRVRRPAHRHCRGYRGIRAWCRRLRKAAPCNIGGDARCLRARAFGNLVRNASDRSTHHDQRHGRCSPQGLRVGHNLFDTLERRVSPLAPRAVGASHQRRRGPRRVPRRPSGCAPDPSGTAIGALALRRPLLRPSARHYSGPRNESDLRLLKWVPREPGTNARERLGPARIRTWDQRIRLRRAARETAWEAGSQVTGQRRGNVATDGSKPEPSAPGVG